MEADGDGETFEFAPDELDEMPTVAAVEARRGGYDRGLQDVRCDPVEACSECGEHTTTYHLSDGEVVRCLNCRDLFQRVEEPARPA